MTIPTTFSNLSTTPSANSPAGSDAASSIDDNIRVAFAFLGSIYANSATNGWTSPYLPTAGGTVSGNLTVSGTLTGSTGLMNIGAGQLYKSASGTIGIGTTSPTSNGANYSNMELRGTAGGGALIYAGDSATKFRVGYATAVGGGVVGTTTTDSLHLQSNSLDVMELRSTKVVFIADCTSAPAASAGGGVLYVEAGALKFIGSSGTVTTLAAA